METIREICKEYEVEISQEAEEVLLKGMERKEWNEQEQVMLKLKNNVCNEIYELLLSSDMPKVILKEMAENILKRMEPVKKKMHTMGFC